jgi:hypothetical protein
MAWVRDIHRFGTGPFDIVLEETFDGNAVLFEQADLLRLYALMDMFGKNRYHRMQVRRFDLSVPDPLFGDEMVGMVGSGPFDVAIKADQHSSEIAMQGLRAREVKRAMDKFNLHRHRQMVIERNDDPIPEKLIKDAKERSDYD